MSTSRLVRAEVRKLTTTKLILGFGAAAVLLSGLVLLGIVVGSQTEGPGAFVPDTPEVQRQLLAFGGNALLLGGLLGAVAAAREYARGTAVPMFLVSPRRTRAMVAQLVALAVAGGLLGLLGGAIAVGAGAVALPMVDIELQLGGGELAQLVLGSGAAGLVGAVLGVGVGALLRNTGAAVTVVVLGLMIVPPLLGQLVSEISTWTPNVLVTVVSGASDETGLVPAIAALLAWGVVPAVAGVLMVRRRDVV